MWSMETTTKTDLTPATDKQISFIRTLLAERDLANPVVDGVRLGLNVHRENGTLTAAVASQAITLLLGVPKAPKAPAAKVPAGRYALVLDGTLHFFKIDAPAEGKWAGHVFVKEQASDDEYPVKGARRAMVLGMLASDIDQAEASARYGREIGQCGVCGKTLTEEASRAAGIGPICRGKLGW